MDFARILGRRRMVRSYRDEPVPRETLERIVATVRRAPSAGFSQGQRLLVVTDDATRRAISDIFREHESELEPWLSAAPAHVVVGVREQDYHDRYLRPDKLTTEGAEIDWPVPYWYVDAGAAAMLLLLAAIDEGLAAGLTGVPVEYAAQLRALLGIPDDVALVALVTVGHAAPDPGWTARSSRTTQRRRGLDELVHWERWS